MDRLFLDANVIFSAAYKPDARVRELWGLARVELVTSGYALEEASRNLAAIRPGNLHELERLTDRLRLAEPSEGRTLPAGVTLNEKDRPVFLAALEAGVTHFLTGDRDFDALLDSSVEGVLVLRPGEYLRRRKVGRADT